MARKPPDWRQPSLLFPPDPAPPTEPQDKTTPKINADQHALQDDHFRAAATTAGDIRAVPQGPDAAAGSGTLCPGAQGEPRSLEATPIGAEAGPRPEPDSER